VTPDDPEARLGIRGLRDRKPEAPVRPGSAVVEKVLGENSFELMDRDDEQVIEHSARRVSTQRSAYALARGAWTGVRTVSMPSLPSTALASPVANLSVRCDGLCMDESSGGPRPECPAAEPQLGPIKLFEFLRTPRESVGRGLHRRWAEERSSLISQRNELGQHLRAHDLYERLPAAGNWTSDNEGAPDDAFEAVSVQWFDSHRAYEAMSSAPGADELKKLDQRFWQGSMPSVLTGPPDVILGPPGGVPDSGASLICILRRAPGMDLAFFHDHWLGHHGGLFQTILELREPMLGYEQNHGIQGASAAYDGVTQQWFTSPEAFATSTQVPAFSELVTPDTAYFLDADHLHFIIAGPPTRVFG
jgi:hypothetical protein